MVEEFVKGYLFRDTRMINARNKKWCQTHYPLQYDAIMQSYPEYTTFVDKAFALFYGKSFCCENCKKTIDPPRKLEDKKYFCSRECSKQAGTWKRASALAHSAEANEKRRQTCLERYGVDNPLKSPEIRMKQRQTMMTR